MTADDEDDDDDDDDDERGMIPPAAADYLISDDTVQHSSAPDRSTRIDEFDRPAIAPVDTDDSSLQFPAEKKLEDEQLNYDSDPPLKQAVLRDSVKNDYYEDYDSVDNKPGKTLAVRSSANNIPASISDVYFIGMIRLFMQNIRIQACVMRDESVVHSVGQYQQYMYHNTYLDTKNVSSIVINLLSSLSISIIDTFAVYQYHKSESLICYINIDTSIAGNHITFFVVQLCTADLNYAHPPKWA